MTKTWVHRALLTTIACVSLACWGGKPELVDVSEPSASQAVPVVAEPVGDHPSEPVAVPVIEAEVEFTGRLPPAAYSNAWLVIVASTPTPEPIPPVVFDMEETSGGLLAADRLDSGQFKGLMPCWSIAIAGASEERSVAAEMLALLTDHGVDAYIKNAGEYVGDDPRVQAICEDMRSEAANACAADGYMTQVIDGRWHMQVPVPQEVAERTLAGAPAPEPANPDKSVWTATLTAETVGDVGVGDVFFVDELSGQHTVGECTVTGFSAVTLGIPHFSYEEFGDGDSPGCGTAAPWAILDCGEGDRLGVGIATKTDGAAQAWGEASAPGAAESAAARAAVDVALADSEFRTAKASAQSLADAQGETLNEETSVKAFSTPSGAGFVITARWWTRDGEAYCGNDDVLVSRAVGIVDGRVQTMVADTTYSTLLGVIEFAEEPTAQIVTEPMFGGVLVGHEDQECGITVEFCSCAC